MKICPEKLRTLRLVEQVTTNELVHKARVSRWLVYRLEHAPGPVSVRESTVIKLARALGVRVESLEPDPDGAQP